jgi:carbon-monoxide dehydrogenase iron sulfur subunit
VSEAKLIEVCSSDCVGCRLCEMVCSLTHEGECSTTRSRIKVFRDEEFGDNLISLCMQCMDAHCIESCVYGALSRNSKTGAVLVDDQLCNGCQACVTACPLWAVSYDKKKKIVLKCDLCGGHPECVKVCSREALRVKDIDPNSEERKSFMAETSKALSQMRK